MPIRRLDIAGPLDLRATLRTLDVGRWVDGAWWWATWGGAGPSTIAVTRTDHGVEAEAWGPDADRLLDQLPRLVGADAIAELRVPGSAADRYLVRARGLRLGATGDLHEALVASVLGQVVTTTEAGASMRSLRRTFGALAPGPIEGLRAVPTPEVLAALRYEELHRHGIERRRAGTLIEVARRWGRIAALVDRPVPEVRRALEAVRGIGPWSSAHVAGSALGAADVIPIGDYHLPHQVGWTLAGEPRGDDDRMIALLEPFRPNRRWVLTAIVQSGVRAPRYGPKTAIRTHL